MTETATTEMRTIDDLIAEPDAVDDEKYYAGEVNTTADDNGFQIMLDDDKEAQIEASGAQLAGLTLGLGHLRGGGWGEVTIDWAAVQTLADELNTLVRQSRINRWS